MLVTCRKIAKLIGSWIVLGLIAHVATVQIEAASTLNFTYQIGGAVPPPGTIELTDTSGARFTASTTTTSGGNWLSVSPTSGRTSATLTVSVLPAGLATGTYNGSVIVDASGITPNPQTFPVQLTVVSTPILTVNPASLSFSFPSQTGGSADKTFNVTSSSGSLNYSIATSGGAWLSATPANGNTNQPVTVSINPAGLAPGTYNGLVNVSSAGASNSPTVSVTLTVAALQRSPSGPLTFTYQLGGATPPQQGLTISSTAGPLNFSVSATTSSGGNWLSVNPTTSTTQSTLAVAVNATGLAAGTYSGTISISSTGAPNSPLTIPVALNVAAAPILLFDKSSLSFSYQQGKTVPSAQSVSVGSSGTALNYTATASTASGESWLSVTPSSGATPGTLSIGVNPAGLAPGIYNGAIAISSASASNSPLSIAVVLNVAPPPTLSLDKSSLTFSHQPGSSLPSAQSVSVSGGASVLPYNALASTVSGGSWLSVTPSSGSTPGILNISVNPTGLATGTYTGAVAISSAGASNSPRSIAVVLNVAAATLLLDQSSLTFTHQPGGSLPAAQSVSVVSSGGALPYTASTSTTSGGSWLNVTPSGGSTPATLSISVNPAGLATGTYTGSVVVASAGAGTVPKTVSITLTVGGASTGAISPSSLSFTFGPCVPPPSPQPIFVSAGAAPVNFTVSTSAAWLLVSATNGTTPATIGVGVNTTGLSEISYSGTITVTFEGSPSRQIPVSLTLGTADVLYPSSDSLVFTYQPGFAPAPEILEIASSCAPVDFTISIQTLTGATTWLSATPSSGSTNAEVTVTASPVGLQQGTYFALITVAASSPAIDPIYIPVEFTLGAPPLFSASPRSLTFSYRIDDALPNPQNITFASEGAPVDYTLAASQPNSGNWLSLDAMSGTTPSSLSVSVEPSGLLPGSYSDVIRITTSDPTVSPQLVIVNLIVTDSFTVSPRSLSFRHQVGTGLPPVQRVVVSNGGGDLGFTASASTSSGGNWLSVSPSTGSVTETEEVSVNPLGLAPGLYEGAIRILNSADRIQTIPVTLTVTRMSSSLTQTISHIADGAHWQTDIILVNTDTVSASFTLNIWGDDGHPLALPTLDRGPIATLTDTIPVGGSRTIRSAGTASVLSTGWAEVISSQSIGGSAVFRELTTGQEASVPLTSGVPQRVSFPFENGPGLALGIALANTDANQGALVSVTLRNEQGEVISVETPVPVPQHGHTSFVLPVRSSRPEDQRGVVELTSSANGLAALAIRSYRGAFTSREPLFATGQASQFISHIADGGQWQTDIVLVNLDNVPATFTLNARGGQGAAWPLPLPGGGSMSTITDTIPVGGSRTIRTTGTSSVPTTGWAEVNSSQSIGGSVVFRLQETGQEASVSLTSAGTRRMLFPFENGPGLGLGIALANPSHSQGALVSVTLRNEQGQLISNEAPVQLQVDGHTSFVIPVRSSRPEDQRGVVELSSPDSTIVGLGIRGNGKAFTSVGGTH